MTTVGSKISLTGIDHVVLHVKDLERSRRFYMDLLGMKVNHESSWQSFLYLGSDATQMVALFEIKEGEFEGPRDMNHMAMVANQGSYESIKAELEHGRRAGVGPSRRPQLHLLQRPRRPPAADNLPRRAHGRPLVRMTRPTVPCASERDQKSTVGEPFEDDDRCLRHGYCLLGTPRYVIERNEIR